jgi:hypothetical protein
MDSAPPGFEELRKYPLFDALHKRRSRRISKGIPIVRAGSNTYEPPPSPPQPLDELEEAILIAVTGATGFTLPDRPFQDPQGNDILGTPNLNFQGRAAGSTDNAQATHFFLFNDSGSYFLKRLEKIDPTEPFTPEVLIERARKCKQKIADTRPTFPREFPYYLDSNRFLSNVEGSTVLFPVVDMTRQYINALMYVLTESDGYRPTIVDDRNFYRLAGVRKWVKSGFLNKDVKLSLGVLGSMRTQIEADLLLQNLMLVLQAMGLGGWIHASILPVHLLGNPWLSTQKGLGFDHVKPPFRLFDFFRWGTFLTKVRSHPVGLKGLLEGLCPPYVKDMNEAVQKVIDQKYGPNGVYRDAAYFDRIFKDDRGQRYLREVPHYREEVVACVKDICTYIYETHGRFPAHVDAIFAPGVWLQAHHLDLAYYDTLFRGGYTETQAEHQRRWHS